MKNNARYINRKIKVNRYNVTINSRRHDLNSKSFFAVLTQFLLIAGFGVFLVFFGFKLYNYMTNDQSFMVNKILIENNITVTEKEIINAIGLCKGLNIFKINAKEYIEKISQFPNIKSATVLKKFPDTIVIRIKERTPIFQFFNGCYFFIDEEGVVLAKMAQKPDPSLPVVQGIHIPEVCFGAKMEQEQLNIALKAVSAYNHSNIKSNILFQNFDISQPDNIVIHMESGSNICLGDSDFEYRFMKLNQILQDLQRKNIVFESIDLRFENVPVILRNTN